MKRSFEELIAPQSIFQRLGWPRVTAIVFAAWTIFGLIAATQMYANTTDERAMFPLKKILHLAVPNAWVLAAVSIPVLALLSLVWQHVRATRARVSIVVALMPLFLFSHVAIRPLFVPFVVKGMNVPTYFSYWDKVVVGSHSFLVGDAWGYLCLVLAFLSWQYAQQTRLRALREERLQTKLARAELQVLKMQLQPHFLFNTLNTIYNLAPQNSRKAQLMIARLADLLRLSLDHVSTNTVPLQQEIEFLNSYLEIEKTRFDERLCVRMEIAPETLDALVPNMILQPLVENAIRHGVSKKAAGGTVTIRAQKQADRLQLSVIDDGRPFTIQGGGAGIGLSNTRARLTQLYGENFRFELVPGDSGARAELDLPFQLSVTGVEAREVV